MKISKKPKKSIYLPIIFTLLALASSNASQGEILIIGNPQAGSGDSTIHYWYRDVVQQILLMQQERAAAQAEAARAQERARQQAAQANAAFSQCMGRAGYLASVCQREAAVANEFNVRACGDIPGSGASVSVQLSFGSISISGSLDGQARVNHCKDVAAAHFTRLTEGCNTQQAKSRLACY